MSAPRVLGEPAATTPKSRLGGAALITGVATETPAPAMLSGNGGWPTLENQERDYIQKVLAFTNHQMGESARILDLPRTTLWRKMKKYGLTKT